MRNHYRNDPYPADARYSSTCFKCGGQIRKGDPIFIWPSQPRGKKACHEKCGEDDFRRFEAAAQDEYLMTGGRY